MLHSFTPATDHTQVKIHLSNTAENHRYAWLHTLTNTQKEFDLAGNFTGECLDWA